MIMLFCYSNCILWVIICILLSFISRQLLVDTLYTRFGTAVTRSLQTLPTTYRILTKSRRTERREDDGRRGESANIENSIKNDVAASGAAYGEDGNEND